MADTSQVTLSDTDNAKSTSLPVLRGSLGTGAGHRQAQRAPVTSPTIRLRGPPELRSAITYIDGDQGVLLYRGYPIDQLAEHSSFLEVAYLLINGELPSAAQFESFEGQVTRHTMMHESLKSFLHGFRHDAHPMAMLAASVASMSAFYHDTLDLQDPEQRRLAAIRLIAKVPTLLLPPIATPSPADGLSAQQPELC